MGILLFLKSASSASADIPLKRKTLLRRKNKVHLEILTGMISVRSDDILLQKLSKTER